ncbi:SPOR domain-containing protein [Thiosulfativibrio zosterae]|uniref:SPOR domain-containing protein n=1 Tax=Thiosulfativibrio zosterae TaxID=2675053 RepID=A0A6F8PLK3_9GAMM|nr:SPOR domain-containing protein [Thiosulfativibrio zosterae]BBP42991.1 hypothetical protein THMIRHAT_07370 [Thiosulfativibrio zosterae]
MQLFDARPLVICFGIILSYFLWPITTWADNQSATKGLLFDPISGKMISQEDLARTQIQTLILDTYADNILLGELSVEERGEDLWVDFEELLRLLDFPIPIQKKNGILGAEGWFIRPENRFKLSPTPNVPEQYDLDSAFIKDKPHRLDAKEIEVNATRIKVKLVEALSWFGIRQTVNATELILKLIPQQKLPIQERLMRELRQKQSIMSDFEVRLPRQDVPYQAFSPVFSDVQFSLNRDYQAKHRLNLSLLGSGDLAYMTARYFGNLNYDEVAQRTQPNFRLALERSSLDSEMLGPLNASYVSLLDISTASIAHLPTGGNDFGVRASNRPLGRVTNASSTTLSGFQQPGWEVELYLNGIFLERLVVGEDGRYQFVDQPLSIGENRFILKFYGPQGQRDEKVETYVLDQASLVGGGLIYDVSLTRQDWQLSDFIEKERQNDPYNWRFNTHLEAGLTQNISITGDLSQYYFTDQTLHQFIQPGIRVFWNNFLVNASWLQDLAAGSQTNFSLSRGLGQTRLHKFSYSLEQNSADFAINADALARIKNAQRFDLQGPLNLGLSNPLSYQLTTDFTETYEATKSESYGLNLGTQIGTINLANNLIHNQSHTASGDNKSTSGNFQVSGRFGSVFVRNSLQYNLEPTLEFNSGSLDFLTSLGGGWSTEINYTYDFVNQSLGEGYALDWQNKDFIARFKLGKNNQDYNANLIVRFAFGQDPLTHRYLLSSSSLANTGGVSALVFEDLNNNQRFDLDEPVIENAELIAVQQHRRAKTDQLGVATLKGLYDNQPTDLEVDQQTLADPFWMPSQPGVSFLPRPGVIKTLFIPIVLAGEVEGTVRYAESLFAKPQDQGRVPMVLSHKTNPQIKYQTDTAYDGYYLFEKVAPGNYWLLVDPKFLQEKGLRSRNPLSIEVNHRGALVMGANFELFPVEKYNFAQTSEKEEPFQDRVSGKFLVNLGTFISEKNAQTVLQALRSVFPGLWAQVNHAEPLEMSLEKTTQNQFVFWLGVFRDLNHVKYLCGALVKEGLTCQVKKITSEPVSPQILQLTDSIEVAPYEAFNAPSSALTNKVILQNNPAKSFTLQLMSVKAKASLEAFVQSHHLQDTWIETVNIEGDKRYRLNMGHFANKASANKVAQKLQKTKGLKAWIKPI